MGFLSDLFLEGLSKGSYDCPKCGATMFFEDEEHHDTLICPECGYDVDIDDYGHEDEDEEDRYPRYLPGMAPDDEEEDEDNEYGETYDEVCGELSDDDEWMFED